MRYGEVISRSLRIAWRYRYLWLLGVFAGEGAGGGGGSGGSGPSFGGPRGSSGQPGNVDPQQVLSTVVGWLQDHVGLVIGLVILFLLLVLLLTAVSAVAQAALIRASAEHDAERPYSLGPAVRFGLSVFWRMLGLKLLALAYGLVVLAVFLGLVAFGVSSYLSGNYASVGVAVVVGVALGLLLIPVTIVVDVVLRLAARAVALDGQGPLAGVGSGFRLLGRRFGRVALIWLIYLGIGIAAGLLAGVALLLVALPLGALVALGFLAGSVAGAVVVGVVAGLVFLAAALVVGGALGAYFSTFWTLAYRRFDLEPAPLAVAA